MSLRGHGDCGSLEVAPAAWGQVAMTGAAHDRRHACGAARHATVLFVATSTLKELLALDVETRLTLVHELWDSIVKEAQAGAELPIAEVERQELDDRLLEDDKVPEGAISWPEARARLRSGR